MTLAKIADRALTPVSDEKAFRFADGALARDLREFRAVLANADVGLVEHHRHHYHYWVEEVVGDARLAKHARDLGERETIRGEDFREALLGQVEARLKELDAARAPKKGKGSKASTKGGAKKVSVRVRKA